MTDRRSLTIQFPLPPVECSPNGRHHWAAKHRAVSRYRERCADAILLAVQDARLECRGRGYLRPPVVMDLEFYQGGRCRGDGLLRATDADNCLAACKPLVDEIVRAGLLPDDNHRVLRIGTVRLYRTAKEHMGRCCVVVRLEEEHGIVPDAALLAPEAENVPQAGSGPSGGIVKGGH